MITLKDLQPVTPRGAIKEIADKSGVGYTEVTRMFKGLETKDTPKVLKVTKELLRDRGIMLDPAKFGENALQEA
ncbi:MAG TPA: hypothetical protein DIW31_12460 [Bacteroidales bacterium]|nr:hypothetical protein [Bacteroidales bacterium]